MLPNIVKKNNTDNLKAPPIVNIDNSLNRITNGFVMKWVNKKDGISNLNDWRYILAQDVSDKGAKRFKGVDSVEEVLQNISENNHIYECIRADHPRKLYFDIEWNDAKLGNHNDVINQFLKLVKKRIKDKYDVKLPFWSPAISGCKYTTNFDGDEQCKKRSYHITINCGYVFKNQKDIREFINVLITLALKEDGLCYVNKKGRRTSIIDSAPYSAFQSLKCINQSKKGKINVQIPKTLIDEPIMHLATAVVKSDIMFPSHISEPIFPIIKEKKDFKAIKDAKEQPLQCIFGHSEWEDLLGIIPIDEISYEDWLKVLWSLADINQYEVAFKWSSESERCRDNFNEYFDSIWKKFVKGQITIKTLYFIAKRHNPIEFVRISNEHKNKRPLACITDFFVPDYVTYYPKITVEQYDDKYMRDISFDTHQSLILHAHMGFGKTYQILKVLNQYPDLTVLLLSPRIKFCISMCNELNRGLTRGEKIVSYIGDDGTLTNINKVISCKKVFISIESLHKLTKSKYDIVIIDECESVFSSLSSSHLKESSGSFNTLCRYLREANNKIYADAFITNRTLDLVDKLDSSEKIRIIQNTRLPEQRTAYECKNHDELFSRMISDLEKGKKIYFYCEVRKILEDLKEILKKRGFKFIIYIGGTSSYGLENVNESWSNVQLVGTTSTITVGINYDVPDQFHKVYMIVSHMLGNIRDAFQSSKRVRHLIDNELVYTIRLEGRSTYDPLYNLKDVVSNLDDDMEILDDVTDGINRDRINQGKETKEILFENNKIFNRNKAYSKLETNLGRGKTELVFDFFLLLNNYKKKKIIGECVVLPDQEQEKPMKKSEVQYSEIDLSGFDNEATVITDYQKLQRAKSVFNTFFATDIPDVNNFFKAFLSSDFRLNSSFWCYIAHLRGLSAQLLKDIKQWAYKVNAIEKTHLPKLKILEIVCKKLGVKLWSDNSAIIDERTLNKVYAYVSKNTTVLQKIFGISQSNLTSKQILNKILGSVHYFIVKLLKNNRPTGEYKLRCNLRQTADINLMDYFTRVNYDGKLFLK